MKICLEYKHTVFISHGNYKVEEIIEFLNNHELCKNSRTKLSIDRNKYKVKLFSKWDIDFTLPNTVAKLLGFENKVLRAYTDHISNFIPKAFETRTVNIHYHLVNSNIVNEYTHSDIIYSFSMENEKASGTTSKDPNPIIFYPFIDTEITHLRIDIRNQDGKHIEFLEPVSMCLVFKPITD